jgi:Rieske Fe-S protein
MTYNSTRRTVLGAGAATFAAGCVGCGNANNGSKSSTSVTPKSPSAPSTHESVSVSVTTPKAASTPAGHELTKTTDVPVGGGTIFKEQKVVVTQPKKGEFKAFSAICTHEGCTVAKVADGTIDCPCHGSKFHIADGSVAHGPAMRPLPVKHIKVSGKSIYLT